MTSWNPYIKGRGRWTGASCFSFYFSAQMLPTWSQTLVHGILVTDPPIAFPPPLHQFLLLALHTFMSSWYTFSLPFLGTSLLWIFRLCVQGQKWWIRLTFLCLDKYAWGFSEWCPGLSRMLVQAQWKCGQVALVYPSPGCGLTRPGEPKITDQRGLEGAVSTNPLRGCLSWLVMTL